MDRNRNRNFLKISFGAETETVITNIPALNTLFMKFLCVVFCGMFSSEEVFPIGCPLSKLQLSKGRGPGAATRNATHKKRGRVVNLNDFSRRISL